MASDAELIAASRAAYDQSFPGARPWLFGVAHNTLRRHWRSRPAEDPVVRSALARLRPTEREVLTLVAWEDLTVADAARVLGIPAGTARRCLHQARQGLRNAPGMAALMTDLNTVKETT
jgi:DNA-directed RNA polymerase specialized sigma24 family protein